MPTKPTDTIVQIATDAVFSTSPVPAVNGAPTTIPLVNPAEGLIPGLAAGAANLNWLIKTINRFIQWVKDGTSDPDLDAHIVETDSLGQISAGAVLVSDNTGYNYGIIAGNGLAGDAAARAIVGYQSEDGIGIEGRNTSGSGSAMKGTCAGTGGHGVWGVAAGAGVGAGVYGNGQGAFKAAVIAERTLDNAAPALVLTGNHAAPVRGLLSIGVQSTEPSTFPLGDFYRSSVDMRIAANSRWNSMGFRAEGWIDALAYFIDGAGGLPVPDSGSYTDVVSLAISAVRTGMIEIEASVNFIPASGSTSAIRFRLYDVTAATPIGIVAALPVTALGLVGPQQQSIRFAYEVPAGARTIKLQAESFGAASAVDCATLTVKGIFTI